MNPFLQCTPVPNLGSNNFFETWLLKWCDDFKLEVIVISNYLKLISVEKGLTTSSEICYDYSKENCQKIFNSRISGFTDKNKHRNKIESHRETNRRRSCCDYWIIK